MKFSRTEIRHLFRAWIIISLAFAIFLKVTGLYPIDSYVSKEFLIAIIVSAFTVGIGFVFHELGHKFLAQKYGCWAEFRANNFMLMLALLFSFLGVILAAPGGVFIKGNITKRKHAYIAMSGPLINIILGILFGLLAFLVPQSQLVAIPAMTINFWLGLFNILPFPMFDGFKVYLWNKIVYVILLVVAIVLTFGSGQLLATVIA